MHQSAAFCPNGVPSRCAVIDPISSGLSVIRMFHLELNWPLVLLSAGIALVLLTDAWRRAHITSAPFSAHLAWALATAVIFLGRQMSFELPGGVQLHYLGGAFLALVLGYPRALLSMSLVLAGSALLNDHWQSLGLQIIFSAALPVATMALIARVAEQRLPGHLFVFLLGTGFFGLYGVYAFEHCAAVLVRWALTDVALPADLTAYALLLASGEAWMEGMLITILAVYAPDAVRLFNQAVYLQPSRPDRPG